jgi:hypothetical protein
MNESTGRRAMTNLHKEIRPAYQTERDRLSAVTPDAFGSALALRLAEGAEPDAKVGNSQPETEEDYQEHEKIAERHVQ